MPQLQGNRQQGNGGGLLGALLDLAVPNAAADTMTQANTMNQQTTQKQQLDPYQEGVKKALKQAGEQHTLDAMQQGVPADHIVKESGLTPQQPVDPAQILASVVATHLATQGQQQQPGQADQAAQTPQQNTGDFGYKPDNVLSKLFSAVGIQPSPDAQVMLTQAQMNRQKMAGQEPIQPAQKPVLDLYTAQTKELNQKIAGAEPIQPKELATLNRETYSATIQAANDAWQRNTDEIKTMQEQYKALQENRSGFGKVTGGVTSDMQKLQKVIIAKMKQNQSHLQNMQTIFANPPKATSEQPASVNNSPFKVGQNFNGETIKSVKRMD